jgi:hypothetical protein
MKQDDEGPARENEYDRSGSTAVFDTSSSTLRARTQYAISQDCSSSSSSLKAIRTSP